MKITWKNYKMFRLDEHNIVVERTDTLIADRDMNKPGKSEILYKRGEEYEVKVRLGYFSRIKHALEAILDDYPKHTPCGTLEELVVLLKEAKAELVDIFTMPAFDPMEALDNLNIK
tara:strand:- start:637 stop:984 length:348 start_codon:yes stop_codon:yes gene_type:complete